MVLNLSAMSLVIAAIATAMAAEPKGELSLSKLRPRPETPIDMTDPGASVHSTFVDLNGIRYIKLDSGQNSIYVPQVDKFTPDQLDAAFCADRAGNTEGREVAIIKADRDLDHEVRPYIAVVQKTIQTKCKGNVAAGPTPGAPQGDTTSVHLNPMLEVGVARDARNPDGTTSRTKIFTKPIAGPNLNVGKEF